MALSVNKEYQELYEMVTKEIGKEEADKLMNYKFFSAWGFETGGHWTSYIAKKAIYKRITNNSQLSEGVKQKAKDWYDEKSSSWFWLFAWVIIIGLILAVFLLK